MTNYPYIIACFPDLLLDFERHPLDVGTVVAEVKGQLSESDCKLVDWLCPRPVHDGDAPGWRADLRHRHCRDPG